MTATIVLQNDFKYAINDWRATQQESFQLIKDSLSEYASDFGRLTGGRETTTEWTDPTAPAPANPLTYPPYHYGDGSWHVDPAYTLRVTLIKTTTYTPTGPNTYQATTTTQNPITGETNTDVQNFTGQPPLVQTVNTALTSLVVQPTFGTLVDDCLSDFVDSKAALTLKWAETQEQISQQTRRAMQRASAIVRTIKMAANPLIKIGHTVRLVIPKRDIDALHLVTGRQIVRDCETGDCTMTLTLEFWVR